MQGRAQPPDGARHFGLVVDDKEAARRAIAEAGVEVIPAVGSTSSIRTGIASRSCSTTSSVHEDETRSCAAWASSSGRPTRRSRSCARRDWLRPRKLHLVAGKPRSIVLLHAGSAPQSADGSRSPVLDAWAMFHGIPSSHLRRSRVGPGAYADDLVTYAGGRLDSHSLHSWTTQRVMLDLGLEHERADRARQRGRASMPSEGVVPRNAKRAAPDASPDRRRNALRMSRLAPAPPSIGATSLGLPRGIRACLFDLDGVLTHTAKLHAAAWKRDVRRVPRGAGATGPARPFVPFDSARDYDRYVDGKPRARRRPRRSSPREASSCPRAPGRPPGAETVAGSAAVKNELVLAMIARATASTPTRARCATSTRHATRASGARSSRSSANCREVLDAAGIADLFDVRRRRRSSREQEHLRGKPAPGHVPRRGTHARCRSRAGGRVRGRARRRRGGPRGRLRLRRRRRPRRPGGRAARRTAPTSSSTISPSCSSGHDRAPGLRRRAVVAARDRARPRRARADASRCSRSRTATSACAATSTRASRTALPGTYLNSFYELRPLPYAEAGYGYPESGQTIVNVTNGKIIRLLVDDEPFDVRYGELLRARARARPARRRARAATSSGVAGGHGGPRRARRGSSRSSQRAVAAILYEVEPLDGPVRVVVQSELVANEPVPARRERPARRRGARVAARLGGVLRPRRRASCSSTRRARSGLRMAAGMDHVVEGPDGTDDDRGEPRRRRPGDGRRRPRSRRARSGSSSSSPTAGRASARCRRCATRSSPRSPRRGTPAGTGSSPAQREYLDDFWERADVELDGDTELQQAVRFALFHTLQAGARAERRAIPREGAHRAAATTATRSGTPSASCCRCSRTPRPTRPRDALRWRHATLDLARERAQPARARGRRVPVAHDPRPGVLRLLARRAPRRSTSARDIADAVVRYQARDRRRGVRRARSASSCSSRRRGCGARSATTTPQGRFRIDGVTGPDEYSADRRQQRLHEPHGAAEPARAPPTPSRATRAAPRELGADLEEAAAWRDAARRRWSSPGTTRSACTRSPRASRDHERWDFDGDGAEQLPAAPALSRTSTSTASRW